MSEVKGTLLAIVLAVAVFGVVFGIITVAMKNSAETVSGRMSEASSQQYQAQSTGTGNVVVYTLP